MGFLLSVARGPGAGEEFTFETEARLGRTADNDLVIRDSSASRSHARVFFKGGRHFVEDLGSANGTQVNNAAVKAPRELKAGDSIAIGDVVLKFNLANETLLQPGSTVDDSGLDPNETIVPPPSRGPGRRSTNSVARARPAAKDDPPDDEETAAAPDSIDSADEDAADDEEGGDDAAQSDEGGSADSGDSDQGQVPPPRASRGAGPRSLARGGAPQVPARAPTRGPLAARRQVENDELSGMTAAQRARNRRELEKSAGGRVQLLWQSSGKVTRIILTILGGLFAIGLVGFAVYVALPHARVKKIEPTTLVANGPPVLESFGEGPGVVFRRPDLKTFTFNVNSPTKVVGVLHYQAKNISKDEVTVSLNGQELGNVPPDNIDVEARELDLVLPATVLVLREDNTLTFDNVNNPPAEDEWRIWNIWVEIIPVPDMTSEEAARAATESIEKADRAYELRDIGAGNLFHAWKVYRDAWLLLEATPNRPAALHQRARTRMQELRPELDRRCSMMLVEFKKVINTKPTDINKARTVLKDIPTYFPTREHPCNTFATSLLQELDEVAAPEEK